MYNTYNVIRTMYMYMYVYVLCLLMIDRWSLIVFCCPMFLVAYVSVSLVVRHTSSISLLWVVSGTTHSFSEEEKLAFCDWINYQLEEDPDLQKHLPIPEDGNALFEAVHDGLILW